MSLIIIAVALMVGFMLVYLKLIPTSYINYLYALMWVVVVVAITQMVSNRVRSNLARQVGLANAASVAMVLKLIGYTIAVVGFLAFIRVSIPEALATGGFAGLVVGLAAQNVLSNVIAGLMILFSRPYRIGDRITFTTWQYGFIAPTYPPKFFSRDFLIPGYTGLVSEINLMYTIIKTDEGIPLKIPNSVMVQAAIFVHSEAEVRKVRTRYEVPKTLDPELVLPAVAKAVKELSIVVGEPSVKILDTSQSTYVVGVDAMCKAVDEEPARSEIIKAIMKAVEEVKASSQAKA